MFYICVFAYFKNSYLQQKRNREATKPDGLHFSMTYVYNIFFVYQRNFRLYL